MVRIGVLGTGRITRRLVADMQSTEGVEVVAIASRMRSRARWSADQYGIASPHGDYQSLIDRDDLDAVYIATPPADHAELAIASARSGKHVLCEKPMVVSPAELSAVDEACRLSGVIWMDATAWLHHERTEAFWKWIGDGRLGEVTHVSASVSFYRPFQSDDHRLKAIHGGGCRLDLGWYAAGLILAADAATRSATGLTSKDDEAGTSSVYANAVMEGDVETRVTAVVQLQSRISATLSCGYDAASRKWFEVAGSEASLICDDFTRPWPDRPARCWIHDRAGAVVSESFEGCQERRMIETFADFVRSSRTDATGTVASEAGESAMKLRSFQDQCRATTELVAAIGESCRVGGVVAI